MIFENVFLIRGGSFGTDWGMKLIIAIIALGACVYDYLKNDKRLDYFLVFVTGTIMWSIVELMLQLLGGRVVPEKFFFGLDVSNLLWFTIPVQAMCEAGAIGVLGVYFGDRIFLDKKKRKNNVILYALVLIMVTSSFLYAGFLNGTNFTNVDVGGIVPSRRQMWDIPGIIATAIIIAPTIYWLAITDPKSRKRGLYMILIMLIWSIVWSIGQWVIGERWIEVGIVNIDGSFSDLRRADPITEFLAIAYDAIFEITLVYSPFIAIPYLLGLIKSEKYDKKEGLVNEIRPIEE